jgi:uncharacterized membrane protein
MSKANATVYINKPLEEVFAYTATPHNGPAYIPNLNENLNIHPEEPCQNQKFDWRFNMAGVDLRGQAEVTEFIPNQFTKVVSTGGINSVWNYSYQAEGEGTRVSLDVDYDFPDNVLNKIANTLILEKMNQRSAEQSMENLKTILES